MRKTSIFLAFILVLAFGQTGLLAQSNDLYLIGDPTNSWIDGSDVKLSCPNTHVFTIGATSTGCLANAVGGYNAWQFWSPDSANWGHVEANWVDPCCEDSVAFAGRFRNLFIKEGGSGSWGSPLHLPAGPYVTDSVNFGDDTLGISFGGYVTAAPGGWGNQVDCGAVWSMSIQTVLADSGKHMCFDTSSSLVVWKWSDGSNNWYPTWTDGDCYMIDPVPNLRPSITTCPVSVTFNHCYTGYYDYDATDPEVDTFFFYLTSGPGEIDSVSGEWTWTTAIPQEIDTFIVVQAADFGGLGVPCTTDVHVTNEAVGITCPATTPTAKAGFTNYQIVGLDDMGDFCDVLTVTVVNEGALFGTASTIWTNGDTVFVIPDTSTAFCATTPLAVTFEVEVTDGLEYDTCDLNMTVICGSAYEVYIEKAEEVLQGHFYELPVWIKKIKADAGLGGFDILIAYDNSALSFQMAIPGELLETCGWEYFTYRFGPDGNCGNQCPSGLTRIIAMAEINDGANHPNSALCADDLTGLNGWWDVVPDTLFYLKFLVSNDRNLECQYVPVKFYWMDCGDNILSSWDGEISFLNAYVFDYDNPTSIADTGYGFPGYLGHAGYCEDGDKEDVQIDIDFFNGGIDIICGEDIDARGDINCNGIPYEIADAVQFTNFFIQGLTAFGPLPFDHQEASIAASDANADGLTLTVADLVYLIRVVVGDALPYPKLNPAYTTYSYENSRLSVNDEMGAAFVVFEGDVAVTSLATNMEVKTGLVDGNTHVLVYTELANESFSGDFIEAGGSIVSIEFATLTGQTVVATNIPRTFRVEQNYPNPFNPDTKIDFAIPGGGEWNLVIYNVTGQVVDQFNGTTDEGFVSVTWDASSYASGIYFYKVVAGDRTETKKAVLLK